jgi:hypothetical protein
MRNIRSACWVAVALLVLGSQLLDAHMLMKFPLPRGYSGNQAYSPIDYDLKSPLPDAKMCKGKPLGTPTLTVQAGQTINVQFEGSARHGGGLTQFSLSYDNDKTFVVIGEYRYNAPNQDYSWPVKIPEYAPSCDRCTFAWTWINAVGNREFYMNCADIRIVGQTTGKGITGSSIFIANLPGYPTYQPPSGNADGPAGAESATSPKGQVLL